MVRDAAAEEIRIASDILKYCDSQKKEKKGKR
jgi:hypothetical protein